MKGTTSSWWLLLVVLWLTGASAGCDRYPRDPEETLRSVEETGVLHVGVSHRPPWVDASDGDIGGIEADLVHDLAEQMEIEVRWWRMSESEIVEALGHGEIDLAIGGFSRDSPWQDHVAFTLPYVSHQRQEHVWAGRAGENRWVMHLERFLEGRDGQVRRALQRKSPELTP